MDNKLNTNKVLFNKLNDYFKDNTKVSLIYQKVSQFNMNGKNI